MKSKSVRWCVALLLGGITVRPVPAGSDDPAQQTERVHRHLGRGINLGNALEAPREGAWGLTLKEEYFQLIKDAGFQSVRVPIRWSAHAGAAVPFPIDPAFFQRVDWAIDQALKRGLAAVINVHHYDEIYRAPDQHLPRLKALWTQIAARYRDRSDHLLFELLNEPNGQLTDERWQQMVPELLAVIRASNPKRVVIVGPGQWNSLHHLEKLRLPEQDRRLLVTFHYYSPFEFTHQGASWVKGSAKWKGKTWEGTPQQAQALQQDFAKAVAWAKKNRRLLYLGEFGAYSAADLESRARWTRAVVREAERHEIRWAYWEFGSGFGAYDPGARTWRQPLLQALLGKEP
jgi:endoglucanase